MLVSDLMNVID